MLLLKEYLSSEDIEEVRIYVMRIEHLLNYAHNKNLFIINLSTIFCVGQLFIQV